MGRGRRNSRLSICAVTGRSAGAAVLDRSTLALTGFWKAPFTTEPWVGSPSAGASGGRNMSADTGNPPTASTALNGLASAAFDGTNDRLVTAATMADFIDVNRYSYYILGQIDATSSDASLGAAYDNDPILGAQGHFYFGASFRATGPKIQIWHYDGDWDGVELAASTGVPVLIQAKYDGTNIYGRTNSGPWSSKARGTIDTNILGDTLRLGGSSFSGAFGAFKVWEVGITDQLWDDATFTAIAASISSTYGAP